MAEQPRDSRRQRGFNTRNVARRAVHVLLVLLIVNFATLVMLDLTPGDPAFALLGQDATPEQVAQIHRELGLDDPLIVRWARWIGDAVTGDLGVSIRTHQPVVTVLRERLPVTLELAAVALLMALLVAIPVGVYGGYRRGKVVDRISNGVTAVMISAPQFLTALLLVFFFALKYDLFPPTGWVRLTEDVGDNLHSVFLPSLTLALSEMAVFSRLLRSDVHATMQQDFVTAARARGLPTGYLLRRHVLRPSSFSLLTLGGLSLGRLMGGSIVVETIFGLPGTGDLLVQSILSGDLLMVQGLVLFFAVVYVFVNVLVELAYTMLDPQVRIRRAST